jgi:two-component system sensor kinase FixL
VPEAYREELAGFMRRVAAGERLDRVETVRVTKTGERREVSLTIAPLRNETGQIIGASTIARDVTQRNRDLAHVRGSESRLRSIVESAVDGIVVIDARGIMEAFNPGAERLFGYTASEVVGRNVSMLMPSPYQEEHDGYLARYLRTGERRIIGIGREVTAKRKDGTTFPIQLSVGEMAVDGQRKFTGIIHDLSSRVRVEEQLREQAALVRLGEMAAVIAHEVKNPLAAVRGAIQVIGRRLGPESREAGVITDIIARIDTLNLLVKDLLLFARPPQPKPMSIEPTALLSTTAALLGADAAHRDVRVVISGGAPNILADPELLKIVFINLLINGSQAMQGKGVITIAVAQQDALCRITITDAGPGIPAEVRDKLFTPFVTTKSRGTGLGLSTVKRLVEAHHGSIRLDSPPGGGATVTIDLPLAGSLLDTSV